jgi:hypothetical protein
LWKPFFNIGKTQTRSLLASALLWIIVVAILSLNQFVFRLFLVR